MNVKTKIKIMPRVSRSFIKFDGTINVGRRYVTVQPRRIDLKEYLDQDRKFWLHSSGILHMIRAGGVHEEWLKKSYHSSSLKVAFTDEWIRVSQGGGLNLQGGKEAIRKAFKYWWPTAINHDMVYIDSHDLEKFVTPGIGVSIPEHFSYFILKDKIKLRQEFGPLQSQ